MVSWTKLNKRKEGKNSLLYGGLTSAVLQTSESLI